MQMVLNRLLADEEFFADLLVAVALSDELDNLLFALAQQRLFPPRSSVSGFGKSLHHLGSHAVVEPDLASMDAVNARQKQVRGGLLQHHAPGTETHRADNVAVILRGRQDDDACGQRIKVYFLEHGQTVLV